MYYSRGVKKNIGQQRQVRKREGWVAREQGEKEGNMERGSTLNSSIKRVKGETSR